MHWRSSQEQQQLWYKQHLQNLQKLKQERAKQLQKDDSYATLPAPPPKSEPQKRAPPPPPPKEEPPAPPPPPPSEVSKIRLITRQKVVSKITQTWADIAVHKSDNCTRVDELFLLCRGEKNCHLKLKLVSVNTPLSHVFLLTCINK